VQRLESPGTNGPGVLSERNTNVYRYRLEFHRRTDR
jgi:hypothetical protein